MCLLARRAHPSRLDSLQPHPSFPAIRAPFPSSIFVLFCSKSNTRKENKLVRFLLPEKKRIFDSFLFRQFPKKDRVCASALIYICAETIGAKTISKRFRKRTRTPLCNSRGTESPGNYTFSLNFSVSSKSSIFYANANSWPQNCRRGGDA